jgi:hypothetical protein
MARTSIENVEFTSSPELSDFIIVIGFDNRNQFQALRENHVWQKYPWKSFGIFEGDSAPRYLHGLYCGIPKKWNFAKRFSGLAYTWHQQQFPNPVPPFSNICKTEKDFLFAYIGRNSNSLRRRLVATCQNIAAVHVEDSSDNYNHFSNSSESRFERQTHYWDIMSRAKFAICPVGAAPSSVRLFEMMEAGIAPVVISDQWVEPFGPQWDKFCLKIPESRIRYIHSIVSEIEPEFEVRGRLARLAWEKWFAPERYWDFMMASIRDIQRTQLIPEKFYTAAKTLFFFSEKISDYEFKILVSIKSKLNILKSSLKKN